MTNEQLVQKIKAGNRDQIQALWDQVKRWGYLCAVRFYNSYRELCTQCGVQLDDLTQCAFLALCGAVEGFDPEQGKFTSYYTYHLRKSFNTALGRTNKQRSDPLNWSTDIESPLPYADDLTLSDSLEDPEAAQELEEADRRIYNRELHEALDQCMEDLNEHQRDTITGLYYEGRKQRELAESFRVSLSAVGQYKNQAFRAIRRQQHKLRPFLDEIIETKACEGTGFSAWEHYGSAPERITEYLEKFAK